MKGCTLYFDDRMEAAESDDGHGLCVCPYSLSPELLCQNNCPHGVFAVGSGCCAGAELSLVTEDLCVHAAFDHGEEHGLYGAVELVVLGTEIGCANIGEDCFSDKGPEGRGGRAGKQGKEGLEETGDMVRKRAEKKRGTDSMDGITFLLRRMTRFCRRVLRVSGVSAP